MFCFLFDHNSIRLSNKILIHQQGSSFVIENDHAKKSQKKIILIKRKNLNTDKQTQMNRKHAGILLILMMLGHNYVINQPQSLQQDIEHIHSVTVTEFNLLYSIPSILAILSIIPVGIIYNSYPNFTLLFGVGVLFAGQILASMFGSEGLPYYFSIFVAGRTLEASGAQVLYMIQGNLASSWMGNFAGLVFILPEVGQIMNAFLTPLAAINCGVKTALFIGVIFCAISVIACWYLYKELKRRQKLKSKRSSNIEMIDTISSKQNNTELESNRQAIDNKEKLEKQSHQDQKQYKSAQKLQTSPNEPQSKERTSDQELKNNCKSKLDEPQSILKAGKIFWLTILICAINECLYFPFLDNANEMIQIRFKIPYSQTGLFLCLPFLAAIITTLSMSRFLVCFERKNLIFYTSFLPFLGHMMIMFLPNCEEESLTIGGKLMLASGFLVFGTGIGGYYSVSFPAVGMAVPKNIRGLSYSVLCFFQTLAMSLVPICSGLIIEEDVTNEVEGYRNSSFMFVILTLIGLFVGFLIKRMANENSYCYEDEDELVEQDVEQQSNHEIKIKHNSKQNKDYINIRVERSIQQAN